MIMDEIRTFDSRISAIPVQEIDSQKGEIDFQPEITLPEAAEIRNAGPEIDLPHGEIDFLGGNLNFQPVNDAGQQPFATENGESSRRPARKRGMPQRLRDCEVFRDSDINNDGDLIHFALMAESEPVYGKIKNCKKGVLLLERNNKF
ncbi:hypothetical protein KIW84_072784 [Lathyrus oleraceus]|uniref:Uncharacterized protein n=1 Tax=Pisum sativum TaxID=3888 RepID=A0A9D4VNA1_PEA|nr:hypothetical protein KIW84_072784 [Pisum sativum]